MYIKQKLRATVSAVAVDSVLSYWVRLLDVVLDRSNNSWYIDVK